MTPYQLTVIIYKWKLAHVKYLLGSCFPSGVAFQALDKTGCLLPMSKCIVQVKSTSLRRLWYLPFETGLLDHGEQYCVWGQDFQIHGIFFPLYLLNVSHLAWNIFWFWSVYSLPMKNVNRKRNKRTGKYVPVYFVDLLFCPLGSLTSNFSHLLILLGDFFDRSHF